MIPTAHYGQGEKPVHSRVGPRVLRARDPGLC